MYYWRHSEQSVKGTLIQFDVTIDLTRRAQGALREGRLKSVPQSFARGGAFTLPKFE